MKANCFNEEFYPTPTDLIAKMMRPFLKRERFLPQMSICDPCAGKGHMIDYLRDLSGGDQSDIYCFEKDPDLQSILHDKKCSFLGPDFLKYTGDLHFDLLLMNPPFSIGVEFILHAWDVLEQGHIVCLINTSNILNPYSKNRQLLSNIIEDNGTVEHLGQVFIGSERHTDVEVSLVRLEKKSVSRFDFKFENITKEKDLDLNESNIFDLPATRDVIGNMELQFDNLREVFINYMKVSKELEFYSKGLISNFNSIEKIIANVGIEGSRSYNKFCGNVRKDMWLNVISKLGLERYLTSGLRETFNSFSQQQSKLDFTKTNVQALIQMILLNRGDILENAITEVFDIFTSYHKENRIYIEGWKTNDHWKVNKRVVLPRAVSYGGYLNNYDLKKYGDRFSSAYEMNQRYCDIDKALCYITGDTYEEIATIKDTLCTHFASLGKIRTGDNYDNTCESTYFNLKFFKKGTIHLQFKSERLWQEFNMRACAGKNWLPEEDRKRWEAKKEQEQHSGERQKDSQLFLISA